MEKNEYYCRNCWVDGEYTRAVLEPVSSGSMIFYRCPRCYTIYLIK